MPGARDRLREGLAAVVFSALLAGCRLALPSGGGGGTVGPVNSGTSTVAAKTAPASEPAPQEEPMFGTKGSLPTKEQCLPGRAERMPLPAAHFVLGKPLAPPFPDGLERIAFALGCFWGAEKHFWTQPGVVTTAVGYMGGFTPNPTYREVCSGRTAHAETVLVVFDPKRTSTEALLKAFWEGHDPTQGMRQGNDAGTQYRSAIFTFSDAQKAAAEASRTLYQAALRKAGHGAITTEIVPAGEFYYAEEYHQQYLAKNPGGYCGHGGTGVTCPVGIPGGDSAERLRGPGAASLPP